MTDKPTTVRFAPEINRAIRQFAAEMGISFNAALSVLVSEALASRGIRRFPEGGVGSAPRKLTSS